MSWNVVKLERLSPRSSDNILPAIALHIKEQLDGERLSSTHSAGPQWYDRVLAPTLLHR